MPARLSFWRVCLSVLRALEAMPAASSLHTHLPSLIPVSNVHLLSPFHHKLQAFRRVVQQSSSTDSESLSVASQCLPILLAHLSTRLDDYVSHRSPATSLSTAQVELMLVLLESAGPDRAPECMQMAQDMLHAFNTRVVDAQQNHRRLFTLVATKLIPSLIRAHTVPQVRALIESS